jgi:hypothetical protein
MAANKCLLGMVNLPFRAPRNERKKVCPAVRPLRKTHNDDCEAPQDEYLSKPLPQWHCKKILGQKVHEFTYRLRTVSIFEPMLLHKVVFITDAANSKFTGTR